MDTDDRYEIGMIDATTTVRNLLSFSDEIRAKLFGRINIEHIMTVFDIPEIKKRIDDYLNFPKVGDVCVTSLFNISCVVTNVKSDYVYTLKEDGETYGCPLELFRKKFNKTGDNPREIITKIFNI